MNTSSWGYKILSENSLTFYHALLPKISLSSLYEFIPQAKHIVYQEDGSIVISLSNSFIPSKVVGKILSLIEEKSKEYLNTPNYYYRIDKSVRQMLKPWALAFEGCLGVVLKHDTNTKKYFKYRWEFLHGPEGGIFLEPYTLILKSEFPKIIHPITPETYDARERIEQSATTTMRALVKRFLEAQPGFEGKAILSYVEEKLETPVKKIVAIIDEKTAHFTKANSAFFS